MRNLITATTLLLAGVAVNGQSTDFETEIRPLLVRQCQGCHNDSNRTSGLSLASRAGIAEGGNRSPALDWIVKAVKHEDGLKMPPGRQLSAADVAKLERWIAAGAPWPEAAKPVAASPKSSHWAFKPPAPPNRRPWIAAGLAIPSTALFCLGSKGSG